MIVINPIYELLSSYTHVPIAGDQNKSPVANWVRELQKRLSTLLTTRLDNYCFPELDINKVNKLIEEEIKSDPIIHDRKLLHCSTSIYSIQALISYSVRARSCTTLAAYIAAKVLSAINPSVPGLNTLIEALKAEATRIRRNIIRQEKENLINNDTVNFYETLAKNAWSITKAEYEFSQAIEDIIHAKRSQLKHILGQVNEAYDEFARMINEFVVRRGSSEAIKPYGRITCKIDTVVLQRNINLNKRLHDQVARVFRQIRRKDSLEVAIAFERLSSMHKALLVPPLKRLLQRISHLESSILEYALIAALEYHGYRPKQGYRGKGAQINEFDFLGCKPAKGSNCNELVVLEAKLTLKEHPCRIAADLLQKLQKVNISDNNTILRTLKIIITWLERRKRADLADQKLLIPCSRVSNGFKDLCREEAEILEEIIPEICTGIGLREIVIEPIHAYILVKEACNNSVIIKRNDCNKWKILLERDRQAKY